MPPRDHDEIHIHHHGEVTLAHPRSEGPDLTWTLQQILDRIESIEGKVDTFMADIKTNFATVSAALTQVKTSLVNIAADLVTLKNSINSSESKLTPEDQAALDQLVVDAQSSATEAQTVADSTPDVPPVEGASRRS